MNLQRYQEIRANRDPNDDAFYRTNIEGYCPFTGDAIKSTVPFVKVDGTLLDHDYLFLFWFLDHEDNYRITEGLTGSMICESPLLNEAIQEAKNLVHNAGIENTMSRIGKGLEFYGLTPPYIEWSKRKSKQLVRK